MVTTKSYALDKQKVIQNLKIFLDQFKISCQQKQPPKASDYENILSHDFHNLSNGRLVGKTMQDFLKRIQEMQKRYSNVEFTHIHDCLISGDKVILQYDMDLTSLNGQKRLLNIMAIVTFDGDLITHWSQVSHDKEKDHLSS